METSTGINLKHLFPQACLPCPCILGPRETRLGQIGCVVGDSSDQPLPSGHTVSTELGPSLAPPWPASVLSLACKSPSSLGLAGPGS